MENTFIPFHMEIVEYQPADGTFVVEYVPEDEECYPIKFALTISFHDTDASTPERIINRLANSSPQHFWQQQKHSKIFDHSMREELVSHKSHSSEHDIHLATFTPGAQEINPTQDEIEAFIRNTLGK